MFPTPPSHDTYQPSPTSGPLSHPGMANSNPCTPTAPATASQTADINRTALASPYDPASTVSMEAVGHVFPQLTKFLFDQSGLDAAFAQPVGSALKAQLSYALEVSETREADPLKLVLILSDSLLSLFKDHNFDSCNICECTSSVFGSEMEIYLPNPRLQQPAPPP
ncbi:unnamed protein product, partial [Dibothriocephalus latus]